MQSASKAASGQEHQKKPGPSNLLPVESVCTAAASDYQKCRQLDTRAGACTKQWERYASCLASFGVIIG